MCVCVYCIRLAENRNDCGNVSTLVDRQLIPCTSSPAAYTAPVSINTELNTAAYACAPLTSNHTEPNTSAYACAPPTSNHTELHTVTTRALDSGDVSVKRHIVEPPPSADSGVGGKRHLFSFSNQRIG